MLQWAHHDLRSHQVRGSKVATHAGGEQVAGHPTRLHTVRLLLFSGAEGSEQRNAHGRLGASHSEACEGSARAAARRAIGLSFNRTRHPAELRWHRLR